ncbi:MAG: isoaspartyl peptidase/L-asparaginase [Ignavibacteria bacterium]|nr:isoaspartyl peptidase/L-asparaginase [Ignavibacteria bacterium]
MISLIVHGGAWDIPDDAVEAHRKGCSVALNIGWKILRSGGSAVDAVEQVVRSLEDDETFDAGRGSHLNAIGQVELDASIMNGRSLRCGAVAGLHCIRNPISLARKVMDESEHVLLVGDGAERFASEHDIELCDPQDLVTMRERERWSAVQGKENFTTKDAFRHQKAASDTVGAVALDKDGNMCVGTSTGGTFNKYPGRVGDSPLIGCGTYADNEVGGVSTTGWGEAMIKVVMAKTVIDLMEANGGVAQVAAERSIEILKRKAEGFGGVIVMNARGQFGIAYNTPRMARAYINAEMNEPFIAA